MVASATDEDLIELLRESASLYAGRRADEVDRMRASILARFESKGLPAKVLPFVYEELESGNSAQTIVAAAKALRGAAEVPHHAIELLLQAIDRLAEADDVVDIGSGEYTTVLTELFRTLASFGPRAGGARYALQGIADRHGSAFSDRVQAELAKAKESISREAVADVDCCCGTTASVVRQSDSTPSHVRSLEDLPMQDQDGADLTFGALFAGLPSVIAFFYTRCMVPQKCSLTITKLGQLGRVIANSSLRGQVMVAGITYDPAYDLPSRLRSYGVHRGLAFDDKVRLLRAPDGFEPLRTHFGLEVGFGPVTVNRHRIELLVLDRSSKMIAVFERAQWQVRDVLATLQASNCETSNAHIAVSDATTSAAIDPIAPRL